MANAFDDLLLELLGIGQSAEAPVQIAQMTPEQEAWMKKYDPAAMKSRPAPAKPQPKVPAAPADPLNLKKTTEERMKDAELRRGFGALTVASSTPPVMDGFGAVKKDYL